MRSSEFYRVHPQALVEYVWDNENFLSEDYYSVLNVDTGRRSTVQNDFNGTSTNNGWSRSVLPYNSNERWIRYTDPLQESLQRVPYGATSSIYDRINIYFPDGFSFDEFSGVVMSVFCYDNRNNPIGLASWVYFLPEDGITEIEPVDTFFAAEQRWSSRVTLQIPSPYALSRQVVVDNTTGNTIPTPDSRNDVITSGLGISPNTTVDMVFRFITSANETDDVPTSVFYNTTIPFEFSVPSQPRFAEVGIDILESSEGAFFEIWPTFQGQLGAQQWIDDQLRRGERYQIEIDTRVFEENLQTSQQTLLISPQSDFDQPTLYSPIIKNTNTTAAVEIQALFVNQRTGTSFIRRSGITLLGAQASRYGKAGYTINLDSVAPIKLYQSRPSNLPFGDDVDFVESLSLEEFESFYDPRQAFFNDTDLLNRNALGDNNNRPSNIRSTTVRVPYPVLFDRFNITASSENVVFKNKVWWGLTEPLEIVIYPFDNVFSFQIARLIQENGTPQLINLSGLQPLKFHIKSPDRDVSSDIFAQAGDAIDLANGKVVFSFSEKQVNDIRPLFNNGFRQFYITTARENSASERTVIYSGLYILYDSQEYRDRIAANIRAREAELGLGQGTVSDIEQEPDGQQASEQDFNEFPSAQPDSGKGEDC